MQEEATTLQLVRLRAAANANIQDASLWRWYADLMEDHRISCLRRNESWVVAVAGRELANDRSFDVAVRSAYVMHRALKVL